MTEPSEVEKLLAISVTQQAQIIDILMMQVQMENISAARELDYIHNTKGRIMADLTEEELYAIQEEMREDI